MYGGKQLRSYLAEQSLCGQGRLAYSNFLYFGEV